MGARLRVVLFPRFGEHVSGKLQRARSETNQKLLGKQATSVSRMLPGRPLGELEMLIDVYSPGIYEKSIAFCR